MIFDPNTGNPATGVGRLAFAGNRIPASRLSPQAIAIMQYFPLPNAAGNAGSSFLNNYTAAGSIAYDANKWDTREDYFMNERTSLFGRYSNHQFTNGSQGAFGSLAGGPSFNGARFSGLSNVRNQSIAFGTTHTFSPTLVNEFRFGYMKYRVQVVPNGIGSSPAAAAGIPGLNLDNFFTSGMPFFSFQRSDHTTDNQYTGLGYALGANGCNCPLDQNEGQYQFTDNLSKIAGNHSLKFGADIRYAKNLRVPSDTHRAGELTFYPDNTGYIAAPGSSAVSGFPFATFLLGNVSTFGRFVSTTTNASEHQRRWFFYGQDSWRVTPKLTINYGLRWELVFPEQVNGAANGAQLDLSTGLINVFGIGNVSVHGVQNMNWLNLAPRLGIAYQLNSKTVIRTGYGWAYELGTFGATFGHNVTQNPPILSSQQVNPVSNFQSVFTLAAGPTPPPSTPVPASGQFLLPNGIAARARHSDVRLPRVEAYNFTVERQIFNNTSLSVGYVGNTGRHVGYGSGSGFNIDPNAPAFIPGLSNQNLARPFYAKYGWTQGLLFYCMCANNQYNSLQAQLKRSFSGTYGVQLSYTWQDAQGDADNDYTFNYNRPLGRGRESWIPDHQLTISQNFNIPFGKGRRFGNNANAFVDAVLGGWNLSGVTIFYSGMPLTPSINAYPNVNGQQPIRPYTGPSGRPDIGTGDPYAANQSRDQWFNIGPNATLSSAFAVPANNTFGNYGYNTLRGPIFINQDATLAKNFRLTERLIFHLRGEAYNLFNHANLGLPQGGATANVSGSGAGQITTIAPGSNMRRLQFAARFEF